MSIVLDYTARIAPSALKAADVSGVCRYISLPQDNTAWKRITLAEYGELVANNISVTLNWEYAATDWLGGAAAGRAHGEEAVRQARALGYPAGRVIVGSADFNMTLTQWNAAGKAYAQAFAAAIRAGGFRPGVYGPYDVLTWVRNAGLMDAFWQAGMSTSWSGTRNANVWPGAHLRQRGYKTVAGQTCDWNEILIPNWSGEDMDLTEIGGIVPGITNARALYDIWVWAATARGLAPVNADDVAQHRADDRFPDATAAGRVDAKLNTLLGNNTYHAWQQADVAALAAAVAGAIANVLPNVSEQEVIDALTSEAGQAALVQAANKAEDS